MLFGVSFEVASLVIIVQQIGSTVSVFPTGIMMDRFGRRKIVLAGPILLAISSIPGGDFQYLPRAPAYRFIGGIGEQMWRVGRLTMIADTGAISGDVRSPRGAWRAPAFSLAAIGGFIAVFWDIPGPLPRHALLCLLASPRA